MARARPSDDRRHRLLPYTALAGEGEISLEPYPNIRAWIGRMKQLPKFISMPGI